MMFDTRNFNAMEKSLDAMWLRQQLITQNIANFETPNYKAQDLSFQDVLAKAQGNENGKQYDFQATVKTDRNTEVRPDGNNVDFEAENVKLFNTYYQSMLLYQKISGQFSGMRYIFGQNMK